MRSRFGKWLIVCALVLATGGHWAILQSVAWFGMFVNFSRTVPVLVALEKTFDGRHPCALCKAVQEGKRSEKRHEARNPEIKLDFWLVRSVLAIFPPTDFSLLPAPFESASLRSESPPIPPPRLA